MKLIDQLWNECKDQLTLDELERLVACGFTAKDDLDELILKRLKDANLSDKDLLARLESLQTLQNKPALLDKFVEECDHPLFKEAMNFSFAELLRRRGLARLPHLWEAFIVQKIRSPQLKQAIESELATLYDWRLQFIPCEDRCKIQNEIQARLENIKSDAHIKTLLPNLRGFVDSVPHNDSFLELFDHIRKPEAFERLYHEEQIISAGEYFWLWERYINEKIQERNVNISKELCDKVLPLDEFVRSLNAPPAILCEVFFKGDSCGVTCSTYFKGIRNEFCDGGGYTFNECTFENYLQWFTSGVMQFVRTTWNDCKAPDYRFLIAYEDRIPEICQAMINAVEAGTLPPERFSFGFLNMFYDFLKQIEDKNLFQELPARLLRHYIDFDSCEEKPWGDFCSLLPPRTQIRNLPEDAKLSDFCGKCTLPCGKSTTPLSFYYSYESNYTWAYWETIPYSREYEDSSWVKGTELAGWYRYENFAYVKFDYAYAASREKGNFFGSYDYWEYDWNDYWWEDERREEEDRSFFPEYYHPGKRFGRRHHGGGSASASVRTVLDLSALETRVRAAFKKWDKELEPLVQTVTFLTNHVLSAQGRDVSTWQSAADWLFGVNEKKLSQAVAKLDSAQMVKLTQLCGRLPWPKMRELLVGPIHLCKGECVAPFKELIHGTSEPLSETAQALLQNETFAQVWRLATGWGKIC